MSALMTAMWRSWTTTRAPGSVVVAADADVVPSVRRRAGRWIRLYRRDRFRSALCMLDELWPRRFRIISHARIAS